MTCAAQPDGDEGGVVADHPSADDDDATRRDTRDPPEQDPASAFRLLEVVRPRLRCEPARDLAHRSEQRQCAAVGLDGLVCDPGDPGVDECERQPLVCGDVQVGEQGQARAQARVLELDRLLDLEQKLRPFPHVVHGDDRPACSLVCVVRERAAVAGPIFDEDLMAPLDSSRTPAGVSATRCSWSLISLGTPIRMARGR